MAYLRLQCLDKQDGDKDSNIFKCARMYLCKILWCITLHAFDLLPHFFAFPFLTFFLCIYCSRNMCGTVSPRPTKRTDHRAQTPTSAFWAQAAAHALKHTHKHIYTHKTTCMHWGRGRISLIACTEQTASNDKKHRTCLCVCCL